MSSASADSRACSAHQQTSVYKKKNIEKKTADSLFGMNVYNILGPGISRHRFKLYFTLKLYLFKTEMLAPICPGFFKVFRFVLKY